MAFIQTSQTQVRILGLSSERDLSDYPLLPTFQLQEDENRNIDKVELQYLVDGKLTNATFEVANPQHIFSYEKEIPPLVCCRCYTPVTFDSVADGYFAVCPEHEEDLSLFETEVHYPEPDLKTRCFIEASGTYLTEHLTSELLDGDVDKCMAFVNDHKTELVQYHDADQVWEMIEEEAYSLQAFVENELKLKAIKSDSDCADGEYYMAKLLIQAGEYEKTSQRIVKAKSKEIAADYAIYCESHTPDDLDWSESTVYDCFGEFGYKVNVEKIEPSDQEVLLKHLNFVTADMSELMASGNYLQHKIIDEAK
jgi:hypothetical protein